MTNLQITEQLLDGAPALVLRGELDVYTAPDLCARLEAHRGRRVLLDLSQLAFCDSCGLRALICEAREAEIAGGRVCVVAPATGSVRRLLQLTGLEDRFGVHTDIRCALAAAA
jgi:anti-sigma B factor antagonist